MKKNKNKPDDPVGKDDDGDEDVTADLDRYLDEYRKTLSAFAGFAAMAPEMVGELRRVLMLSSRMVVSNRAGVAEKVQEAAKDMDAFLKQVEAGELNPEDFITEESDKRTRRDTSS